jgi:4,5-DOPA dioxygenase extradiol
MLIGWFFSSNNRPKVQPMNNNRSVLFVPHGSPMFALHPGAAGSAMTDVVSQLATPRAIVVVSPHWETAVPTVGTATRLETIHDFGGFDPRLFEIQYPATGCPEAAQQVVAALQAAGLPVATDAQRGLDHGAWVPLRMMYPAADIPVIPLSIKSHASAAYHYALGEALRPLTSKGFLIIGTGSITHNLRDYMICAHNNLPTPPYVRRFADWVATQLAQTDFTPLINYRQTCADASPAHPTEDHFMPFFVALGAAGDKPDAERFYAGVDDYVIAMDGYCFNRAVQ